MTPLRKNYWITSLAIIGIYSRNIDNDTHFEELL